MTYDTGFMPYGELPRCPICQSPHWITLSEGDPRVPFRGVTRCVAQHGRFIDEPPIHPPGGAVHHRRSLVAAGGAKLRRQNTLCEDVARTASRRLRALELDHAADVLRVSRPTLLRLELGRLSLHDARRLGLSSGAGCFSFPTRDTNGDVVGLQCVHPNRDEFTATNPRRGLFVPRHQDRASTVFLSHGVKSTAALIDLGFSAIGYQHWKHGLDEITNALRATNAVSTVIFDEQGSMASPTVLALVRAAFTTSYWVRVVTVPPPFTSVHAWLASGVTSFDALIAVGEAAPWCATFHAGTSAGTREETPHA